MHVEIFAVAVTTAADGTVTAYSAAVNGLLDRIQYVKTDYDDTVDFTITLEDTGETLWSEANVTASKVVAPRQATHGTDAAAALYAAAGTAVRDRIAVNGRVKIVLAQGGNVKSGTFRIVTV